MKYTVTTFSSLELLFVCLCDVTTLSIHLKIDRDDVNDLIQKKNYTIMYSLIKI